MKNLRLFIAIEIPLVLKERLNKVQQSLREYTTGVKWVSQDNFHLTLKFLGDTPENKCNDIGEAIQQSCQQFSAFTLSLQGLGTFPGKGNPKVLWTGVHGDKDRLLGLQHSLDKKLANLNFPAEHRKYSPHLTLGRMKDFSDTDRLVTAITKHKQEKFGQWQVTNIHLIQSTLTPSGPIYKPLKTVELALSH
ncbi:RNA 2',3'-cyclic phosphodiesterase [Desulfotomaculum sp. 1211_IL3151]|uniref:RNA 2',3'-cyclic phosphodiesterase n=1 Tax=Desulfotomaculum sp. 1211_IL3151 TaxID=3084055 RepID=UPI002FD92656